VNSSSRGLADSAPLEQRLRVIRNKRTASQLSRAITLAGWIAGLTALAIVVVASLLDGH
jgi:hypothetical protein